MFKFTSEQCIVLDALNEWYVRDNEAKAEIAQQNFNRKHQRLRYDHHKYGAALGMRDRAAQALVMLIRVGQGLGLTAYAMSQAMKYSASTRYLSSKTVGRGFFEQAKIDQGSENWSTSDARYELQKLVERQPWMFQVKNEPYRERRHMLNIVSEVRKKQVAYLESEGKARGKTPYDDEMMNAVGTAYYKFTGTPLPLTITDLLRAYGAKSRNTIDRLLDDYFVRGDNAHDYR